MDLSRGRGSPFGTRPARVLVTGVTARLSTVTGYVVNISLTGALVRVPRALAVGSEHPLVLESPERSVTLTARVVRAQVAPIEVAGAVLQREDYALGVVFSRTPNDALEAITDLCGGSLQMEEIPRRVLIVGDDQSSSELFRETLTAAGYLARVVADPRSVASIAKTTRADAVVVNLQFNKEGSLWWVVEALSADRATANLRLIACVDEAALQADRRRYLTERRVHIVGVPCDADEFLASVDRAIIGEP